MKKLMLFLLFIFLQTMAWSACTTENTGFALNGITLTYKCDTEAEFPTSGLNVGDRAIALDTGKMAYATTSGTFGISYIPISRTVNGHALSANVTVIPSDLGAGNLTANIGIGSASPGQALDVNGTVRATAFKGIQAADVPTLNQNTTGSAATVTGFSPTSGKTLSVSKTMTLTAADDTGSYTFPTGTATLLATNGSAASLTSFPTFNQNTTGTASALTSTPTLCSGGQGATGVNASGNAQGCTTYVQTDAADVWTVTGSDIYRLSNVGIGTTKTTTSAFTVMNGNIGIGTWVPGQMLDVQGTARMIGFSLNLNPNAGYVLVGTSVGVGTWMPVSTLNYPTFNQNTTGSAATLTTPRAINGTNFDGSAAITVTASATTLTGTTLNSTVVTSSLTSLGNNVGVGTATAPQALYVVGKEQNTTGIIAGGNVGIGTVGTTIPMQLYTVGGIQATTTGTFGGNVGVGTITAPNALYVVGTPMFTTGLNIGIGTATKARLCIQNSIVSVGGC